MKKWQPKLSADTIGAEMKWFLVYVLPSINIVSAGACNRMYCTKEYRLEFLLQEYVMKFLFLVLNSHAVGWDSWVPSALKSIFGQTLFLKQLHDFSLLSWNSFLHPFLKSKLTKKNSLTLKNFIFEGRLL